MKIRITLTQDEYKALNIPKKAYKNKDGTLRIYLNSLEEFTTLIQPQQKGEQ